MRILWIRNARYALVALLSLALLVGPGPIRAQPVEIPPTWGGDLWSRPRLTGSWFGLRDALGQKGVVFDVDLLLTPQGVATGGRDTGAAFWGNADYTLNVDTGKLGL
jgi:porin